MGYIWARCFENLRELELEVQAMEQQVRRTKDTKEQHPPCERYLVKILQKN